MGWVSAVGKPWMAVYIDGKLVMEERPLERLQVRPGPRVFRFVNGDVGLDKKQTIAIPPDGHVEIEVDARSGAVKVSTGAGEEP